MSSIATQLFCSSNACLSAQGSVRAQLKPAPRKLLDTVIKVAIVAIAGFEILFTFPFLLGAYGLTLFTEKPYFALRERIASAQKTAWFIAAGTGHPKPVEPAEPKTPQPSVFKLLSRVHRAVDEHSTASKIAAVTVGIGLLVVFGIVFPRLQKSASTEITAGDSCPNLSSRGVDMLKNFTETSKKMESLPENGGSFPLVLPVAIIGIVTLAFCCLKTFKKSSNRGPEGTESNPFRPVRSLGDNPDPKQKHSGFVDHPPRRVPNEYDKKERGGNQTEYNTTSITEQCSPTDKLKNDLPLIPKKQNVTSVIKKKKRETSLPIETKTSDIFFDTETEDLDRSQENYEQSALSLELALPKDCVNEAFAKAVQRKLLEKLKSRPLLDADEKIVENLFFHLMRRKILYSQEGKPCDGQDELFCDGIIGALSDRKASDLAHGKFLGQHFRKIREGTEQLWEDCQFLLTQNCV